MGHAGEYARSHARPTRRWPAVVVVLALVAALTAAGAALYVVGMRSHPAAAQGTHRSASPSAPASHSPSPSASAGSQSLTAALAAVTYPAQGAGAYPVAAGDSPVLGHAGTLLRFQVVVERGINGITPAAFAAEVVTILGDPRGWTAGGDWRLQRVGPGEAHDFTVYLATPVTRDQLCGAAFDRYTSCRNGDNVVINVSRWVHGVPYYPDLAAYHEYAVSHEVGHRLGHGHELCAGPGRPAPTMEQQTLGLHGCTPNPWPYLNGTRYAGQLGEYPLNVPTDPPSYYTN
jgi:hypothetical protein